MPRRRKKEKSNSQKLVCCKRESDIKNMVSIDYVSISKDIANSTKHENFKANSSILALYMKRVNPHDEVEFKSLSVCSFLRVLAILRVNVAESNISIWGNP
jgi:hypothetical protein